VKKKWRDIEGVITNNKQTGKAETPNRKEAKTFEYGVVLRGKRKLFKQYERKRTTEG
jgi:hypothetical protein